MTMTLKRVAGVVISAVGALMFFIGAGLMAAIPTGAGVGVDHSFLEVMGIAFTIFTVISGLVLANIGAFMIAEGW